MSEFTSLVGQKIKLDPDVADNDQIYNGFLSDLSGEPRVSTDELLTVTADNQGVTKDGSGSRSLTAETHDGRKISGNASRFVLVVGKYEDRGPAVKIPSVNPEFVGRSANIGEYFLMSLGAFNPGVNNISRLSKFKFLPIAMENNITKTLG